MSEKEFLGGGAKKPSDARVTLIKVPFERTTGWIKGTSHGPEAIICSSQELDDFGTETGQDISSCIHTIPDALEGTPESITSDLKNLLKRALNAGSIPLVLGGEHTITFFSAKAFKEMGVVPGGILTFDAHPDALHKYQGEEVSHASVTRLLRSLFPQTPIYVAGLRVFTECEFSFFKEGEIHFWHASSLKKLHEAIFESSKLLRSPLFISIDLDVLDPAYLSCVSNPVPGGLSPEELKAWLKRLIMQFDLMYIDLVEFSPPPSRKPPLLPAELVKFCAEMISLKKTALKIQNRLSSSHL